MSLVRQFPIITAPYCIALEKSVGALIFRRGEDGTIEYLIMQYPHGHWEFPRGHVERGESEHETMYREIQEETGLENEELNFLTGFREGFSFSYRARGDERVERKRQKRCLLIHKKVVFYLAEATKHEVELSHEHKEFVWLPYAQALEKLSFENARKLTKKADQFLQRKPIQIA